MARVRSRKLLVAAVFALSALWLWRRYSRPSPRQLFSYKLLHEWSVHHNFPLILIDPDVLRHLTSSYVSHASRDGQCEHLCIKEDVKFAVDGSYLQKGELLESINRFQFNDVRYFNGSVYTTPCPWESGRQIITLAEIDIHSEGMRRSYDRRTVTRVSLLPVYERAHAYSWFLATWVNNRHYVAVDRFTTKPIVIDGIPLLIPSEIQKFLSDVDQGKFLECNATNVKEFHRHQEHKEPVAMDTGDFQRVAMELLRSAAGVLGGIGVPFWLSSGTCLGWFRQCDVIPWSRDVDIGIFINNYTSAIIPALQRAGFALKHKFGLVSDSLELSFTKSNMKLDIFFFYEERGVTWNGGTQASSGNKYKYSFPPFRLCWAELNSLHVRVPCETEDYIRANYGPDWLVPVREWDWKSSPPNVRPNGRWPRDYFEDAVQVFQ